jgi:hypothetical protein
MYIVIVVPIGISTPPSLIILVSSHLYFLCRSFSWVLFNTFKFLALTNQALDYFIWSWINDLDPFY